MNYGQIWKSRPLGAKIVVSPSLLIEGFFYWTTSVTRRSKQGLSFLNYRGVFILLDKFGKDCSKQGASFFTYRGIFYPFEQIRQKGVQNDIFPSSHIEG